MKNIALIAIALLASAAFGEPSGPYMSYLGYQVGQSGSGEYSNYIGAYSGQYSTGISRCGFYGPASGQYGYNLYGCNGVGFYALANSEYMTNVFAVGTSAGRDADHCEDCIFIGKDAGRNASGKKGEVVIGDVLIHRNGVTTIKGFSEQFVKLESDNSNHKTALTIGFRNDYTPGIWSFVNGDECRADDFCHAEGKETAANGVYSHSEGFKTTASGEFAHSEGCSSESSGSYTHACGFHTSSRGFATFSAGGYNVSGVSTQDYGYQSAGAFSFSIGWGSWATNQTSFVWQGIGDDKNGSVSPAESERYYDHGSGTFNINPLGGLDGFWIGHKTMRKHISDEIEKPRTSFTIEDEDTGEKYIIKVKSGALKLYKVEETEE